jgi:metallo-beta-lactamase class B
MKTLRPLAFVLALSVLAGCAHSARVSTTSPQTSPMSVSSAVPPCPLDADAMDGWSDRAPPRKIFGNTYYVGTCGIAVILVVGTEGAVLIDGATDKAPSAIEANIRAVGFELRDVKFLLNTHEHSDHAGGLAQLQRGTGAPLLARGPAAETLRRGASERSDPQFGHLEKFPPVADVRTLADGQTVRLGDLELVAHATPGHAPGGTSWTWRSCEDTRCVNIAYVDSHSAISDDSYRFTEHPEYVAAFRRSLDTVAAFPCDILITPHPIVSNLLARFNGDAPLIDAGACRAFAAKASTNLDARIAKEQETPAKDPAR